MLHSICCKERTCLKMCTENDVKSYNRASHTATTTEDKYYSKAKMAQNNTVYDCIFDMPYYASAVTCSCLLFFNVKSAFS